MCLRSAKPAISRVGNGRSRDHPKTPIRTALPKTANPSQRKLHQRMRQIDDLIDPGAE
jgi:hypothetical protein